MRMQHVLVLLFGFVTVGACGGSSDTSLLDSTDGGSDGSSGSSGATGGDGGVNPSNAGPGGSATAQSCGSTSCAIPAEVCCISNNGGTRSFGCSPASTGCATNGGGGGGGDNATSALACSAAANCAAGTVCCVQRSQAGATSACKASCADGEAQLCDPSAAVSGCAPGTTCSSNNIGEWGLPRTYATCGGKGN